MDNGIKQGIIAGGLTFLVTYLTGFGGALGFIFAAGAAHLASKKSHDMKQGSTALVLVAVLGFVGTYLGASTPFLPLTMTERLITAAVSTSFIAVGGIVGLGIYYVRFGRHTPDQSQPEAQPRP